MEPRIQNLIMIVSVLRCPLYRDTHCLQTNLLIFKLLPPQNKKFFVSTANKPLVGTLMTIDDVTGSIAIC